MFHDEDIYPSTRQEKSQAEQLRRLATMRANDRLHQEARDRALREAKSDLEVIRTHIERRNYGMAEEWLADLLWRLDSEHGLMPIVSRHLEQLTAGK